MWHADRRFCLLVSQHGVNGFCVPSGDKDGYVVGLRKLVQDVQLRSKVLLSAVRYLAVMFALFWGVYWSTQ